MTTFHDPWASPVFPEPLADGIHAHPRPSASVLSTDRAPIDNATCPECYSKDLAEYRVLSEGGWWLVSKCQDCLASIDRTPAPLFGSYKPLGYSSEIEFGKASN